MARGDRITAERTFAGTSVTYTHHGIDLGDGTVVHARPDDPERIFEGGRVCLATRGEFASGSRVGFVTDPPARFSSDEVAARALSMVGRDGYCPVVENCEHFATWCATGAPSSHQVGILLGRAAGAAERVAAVVAARMAVGAAERVAVRTALGTTVRLGLRTLLPATIAAEGVALVAEWTAHQAGRPAAQSRAAGESAGLATSAAVCAVATAAGGPAAMVTGALAGAAVWLGGSAAVGMAEWVRRRSDGVPADGVPADGVPAEKGSFAGQSKAGGTAAAGPAAAADGLFPSAP